MKIADRNLIVRARSHNSDESYNFVGRLAEEQEAGVKAIGIIRLTIDEHLADNNNQPTKVFRLDLPVPNRSSTGSIVVKEVQRHYTSSSS